MSTPETIIICSDCGAVENVYERPFYQTSPDGRSFRSGSDLICANCGRVITEEDEVKPEEVEG